MAILVPTGYITPHFTWQEAQCKDGCVMPEAVKPMVLAQAHVLEAVRHALGDQALAVDSWYRCWAHHVAVYAARGIPEAQVPKESMHLVGGGTDIKHSTKTPAQVQYECAVLQRLGIIGGLESAPAHTHVDCGAIRSFTGPSL